jgi:hypothetical protein
MAHASINLYSNNPQTFEILFETLTFDKKTQPETNVFKHEVLHNPEFFSVEV